MSTMSLLNQDIVKARQQKAPELERVLRKAQSLYQTLTVVMSSHLVSRRPEQGDSLVKRLSRLCEQLSDKLTLFQNGVVTVSVAGVEKSGKTTFLKNLTGIDNLPTADERCTSVSCEILYTEDSSREGLDIIYYTRDELQEVLKAQLSFLQDAGNELWEDGKEYEWPVKAESVTIEGFANCVLRPVSDIASERRMLYEGALHQLAAVQKSLAMYASRLGTSARESINNLHLYASHKTEDNQNVSDLQPIIRKIIVHKKFESGTSFLRLCDTPGVDDPNPQALAHTLKAIKTETDLLIIANRPGNMPSLTGPLATFLSNLRKLDTVAPLRDRSIFFVNWHKSIDPNHRNADIRIQKVKENDVFPSNSIYGPCDIMDPSEIQSFMEHVNSRLRNDIPRQDNELIASFTREWKSILSVGVQILEDLRSQAPPMPDELQRQLDERFYAWFDKRYDSSSTRSETEYFMGCLRTRLGQKTEKCRSHETLPHLQQRVKQIRDERMKEMFEWIKQNVSEEKCKMMIGARKLPDNEVLPVLGEKMTALVQELTAVAEEIGPTIQSEVYQVIREALGDAVAAQLCPGSDPGECLNGLCAKLAASERDPDVAFITKNLREFAEISMQMRCIMRHELRPALNLFDPLRWQAVRLKELKSEVSAILSDTSIDKAAQCKEWLGNAAICSYSDAPQNHSVFYQRLFVTACTVIDCVLVSNSNKFAKLMEDFMADASQTLSTQKCCENGWRKALRPHGNVILASEWAKVAGAQANAQQYNSLISNLESALS